ncbi:MAG: multiple sugar transport system substrate-binding protein [Actinomycetota bacterium]|nr:multiple sugar transport system substrate-binding protein [Actinomycetota bacterium]
MMISAQSGRLARVAAVVAVAGIGLAACSSDSGGSASTEAATEGAATGTISIWAHQGQESEVAALQAAVSGFNSSQSDVTAELKLIPEADYTKSVTAASAEELPDVLEIDGPNVAAMVYDAKIQPVSGFVSPDTVSNQTASIKVQNTVNDGLYAISQFNAGLGLAGNKEMLDAAGVKYPTSLDDAWTADEFTAAVTALAAKAPGGKALDIKENYSLSSEWGTFGFSPIIWSAGGNLLQDGKAEGVLNSPDAVAAMKQFQSWKPFIDPNTNDDAFTTGAVALSWFGHWMYPDYSKALGDKLVVMPLPAWGDGVKTGQGSWTWGVSANTQSGPAAGKFLDYLASDESVKAMTTANGAPPATTSALAADTLYAEGGALNLLAQQLDKSCGTTPAKDCVAVSRPVTAGYPVVTKAFSDALDAIYKGTDPQQALDAAAKAIDTDFADNDGYELTK